MPSETLTAPTSAPDQAPSQADAAAPATPRAGANKPGTDGNTPQGQAGAARNPEALRSARLDAARQVRLSRSATATPGSPKGQAAGGDPRTTTAPSPAKGATETAPPPAPDTPGGEVSAATAALKYGAHTAKDPQDLEGLMGLGRRARLEMGPLGEKIAQGEPLTRDEITQLLGHFDTRNAGFQAKLAELRNGKGATGSPDPAHASPATRQQPQTKPGGRGQTPAGSSTSASPATPDGLDEETLAWADDDVAEKIRGAIKTRDSQIEELRAQHAQTRQQLGDMNFAMAVGVMTRDRPDWAKALSDPNTQQAILTQLEKWHVTEEAFASGGHDFISTVREAATLVLLPSSTQQAHADLLARTAAERQGAPSKPIPGRQPPQGTAPMNRTQARHEIAKITTDPNLTAEEKQTRMAQVRDSYQQWQASQQQPPGHR